MNTSLSSHIVHIHYGCWRDFHIDSLFELLSQDEMIHASQIQTASDQYMYVVTRASLRKLLMYYLNVESNDIQIQYGINGKPSVQSHCNIQFSLAHSEEVFVIGFVRDVIIGIDIESLGRSIETYKLVDFLFSADELQKFKDSNTKFHTEQFINCWTRKEAILKSMGTGFTVSPSQLEVSFLKGEKAEVQSTLWSRQEKSEWFLESFDIPENYRGAVAVQGKIESIAIRKIMDIHTHSFN